MRIILSFITLFSFKMAVAQISPIVSVGYEVGGDKLVDAVYSDGSRSDIKAGAGVLFNGGLIYSFDELPMEIQATLGLKFASIKEASNADATFYRFPLELLMFYHNGDTNFRVGGGVTYQFGNKLDGEKDAALLTTDFKNTLGFTLQTDWFLGAEKQVILGLRFTHIRYEAEVIGFKADANSIGGHFSYVWWQKKASPTSISQ